MLNFTVGWARSGAPNSGDYVGELSFPSPGAPYCEDGCIVELGDVDNCFRSDVPASTGLHRISCDYPAVGKGAQCTPSAADAAHDKTQPPLRCPGFVGEVNGQTKCVGTASKPIPSPSGPGVAQATGKGEGQGNPTAGTKPSSGEGSGTGGAGRTPSTGSGTAAGGPAAAAGSKPDGSTPKPPDGKEQAACGAPGQPKCGIDEGGTPGKFDGDKAALDGWKAAVEANRNTMKDADGGFFNSFNLFFSAPPVVACEPIELPNEQVITRHCEVVEGSYISKYITKAFQEGEKWANRWTKFGDTDIPAPVDLGEFHALDEALKSAAAVYMSGRVDTMHLSRWGDWFYFAFEGQPIGQGGGGCHG